MGENTSHKYEEGDELRYDGIPVIVVELLANRRYLVRSDDGYDPFNKEVDEDELY